MATGGTAASLTATQDPSAVLREGRMSSVRRSAGRRGNTAATLSLSMMQATPTASQDLDKIPRRDRVAELRTSQHAAQRYANPGASAPQLQTLAASVRHDGDGEDQDAADALDDSIDDMTNEAGEADNLSMLSRAKSRLKSETEAGMQNMMQKGQKELEKALANLKTEGSAKFASAADEGEGLGLVDTLGTAVSVGHEALSMFQDSFDQPTKDLLAKQGFPILDPSNALDLAIMAGTRMQVLKWSFVVMILIPFCIVFMIMTAVSSCQTDFVCKNGVGLLSTVSNFLGN